MKTYKKITRKFFTLFTILAVVLLFIACNGQLLVPDGGKGGDDLDVPITRLTLSDSTFVAAEGSAATLELKLTRFPPHTTMPDAINWRSFDSSIASVTQDGIIKIELDELPDGAITLETTIRAEFIHDTSVFADATVMIIPATLEKNRNLRFNWGAGAQVNAGEALNNLIIANGGRVANDVEDWYFGNGIFLLTGSGGISLDVIDRGTALAQLDSSASDIPRLYPTTFLIDPADPYKYGITPIGTPQVLGSWAPDAVTRFFDPYDEGTPKINDFPAWPTLPGNDNRGDSDPRTRTGHLRTAGAGMRAFQILGLTAPFEITVKYRSNAMEDRWVDIRFGDTSGFRVEGPLTRNNAANTNQARTVRFRYIDYLYSYDIDGNKYYMLDENGEKISLPEFVPITFIEFIAGIQVWEIDIKDLSEEM